MALPTCKLFTAHAGDVIDSSQTFRHGNKWDNLLGWLPFEWYVENLLLVIILYSKLIQVQPKKKEKFYSMNFETFVKIGTPEAPLNIIVF